VASESALLHSNSIMRYHVTLHDLSSLWRGYHVFDDDDDKIKGGVLVMDINPALLSMSYPALPVITFVSHSESFKEEKLLLLCVM